MREVIYRCNGPDCVTWTQTTASPPARGWLTVQERESETLTDLDFCGWSCVLKYAGRIEPEEVIEATL
jgi:hypothetical protein